MGDPSKVCRKCELEKPASSFGKRRAVCYRCRKGKAPLAPVTPEAPPKRFFRKLNARRYIITAAQNATPAHAGFFKTLQVAAEHLGAELVVIPLRYKNPTSIWSQNQETDEWWAPELAPFLFNQRKKLGPHLVLVGDVKTQPTASSPLSGFESLTGAESCIIGHCKMQFRTVPVPTGRYPKILTTTGVCTPANYTDTKAGAIGAFHHFLGGLVVELDGQKFHVRQINADRRTGEFTDLDQHFTPSGASRAPPAIGLVLGDTHVRVNDPQVDAATFGHGGIVETLDPQTLVFHDVFDGETVNPHDVGDPFISEAKRKAGRLDVRAELQEMVDFVNARAAGRNVVIVDSNHHDFLRRWMVSTDWKQAGPNRRFYLETALYMLDSAQMAPGGAEHADPFTFWVRKLGATANVRCLKPDESFKLADIECGMHGHRGPGGARGSLKNLSRLGAKVCSGHSHTPGIEEGHYQGATSSFRKLSYQRGPDRSLNTHTVVYASGARALLSIIDGAWRSKP